MEKTEKEIQDTLKELADLQTRITADITRYNLLSLQIDTDNRLGLISNSCYRDVGDDERTHEQIMDEDRDGNSGSIDACGSYNWFPSSIC